MENVSELRMKILQLQTELLKQQGENHISYVQHESTDPRSLLSTDQQIELLKAAVCWPGLGHAEDLTIDVAMIHRELCHYIVTGAFSPAVLSILPSSAQQPFPIEP